jgi:hypothetical protein
MKLSLTASSKDLASPLTALAKLLNVSTGQLVTDATSTSPILTSEIVGLSGFTTTLSVRGYFGIAKYIASLNPTFDLSGTEEINEVSLKWARTTPQRPASSIVP